MKHPPKIDLGDVLGCLGCLPGRLGASWGRLGGVLGPLGGRLGGQHGSNLAPKTEPKSIKNRSKLSLRRAHRIKEVTLSLDLLTSL